jgi:hypothetical protein
MCSINEIINPNSESSYWRVTISLIRVKPSAGSNVKSSLRTLTVMLCWPFWPVAKLIFGGILIDMGRRDMIREEIHSPQITHGLHWPRSRISAMRNHRVMSCGMAFCVCMLSCVRVMRHAITADGGVGATRWNCASRGTAFRKQRSVFMRFI